MYRILDQTASGPFDRLGYFPLDEVLLALDAVLASPAFAASRRGVPLAVGAWLAPVDGRTPIGVLYLAHLDDAQRMFLVTLLLHAVVAWSRRQPGTPALARIRTRAGSGFTNRLPGAFVAAARLTLLCRDACYSAGTRSPMIVLLLSLGCTVSAQYDPNGARDVTSISPAEDTADTAGAVETGDTADTAPDSDEPEDTDLPEDTGATFVPDGMTCYSLAPRGTSVALVAVDMDTATVTDVMLWSGLGTGSSFHTYGMTRDATGWATIGYNGNGFSFYHFDLDGTASVGVDAYETSIAWTGTGYLLSDHQDLRACDTWADVQAGGCPAYGAVPGGNSRFTTDGVELYGAWHSTAQIDVYDLGTLARSRTIPLEDWDTWVRGMSVAGGSLFVIDDGRQYPDQRIVEFDPTTGRMRNRVFLPGSAGSRPTGLWCSDEAL